MERVCYADRPRVQHLQEDGDTLCGISWLMMWRVRMGQKGDGLPTCARCAREELKRRPRPACCVRHERRGDTRGNCHVENGGL